MNVLGISYGYHDSSIAFVKDGSLLYSAAEERFSKQKHDASFPKYALEKCFDICKIHPKKINKVVFHEDSHRKFVRVLTSSLAGFPQSRKEFVASLKAQLGKKLWVFNEISSRIKISPKKIAYLDHHYSHSAQAFMTSSFEEAAILIVDAVGDWNSTSTYLGEWKNEKPNLKKICDINFPNSLGLVYSAITAYLGFSPNNDECSTMALAAFGEPVYKDEFSKIIKSEKKGYYSIDQDYFNFISYYKGATSDKFIKKFGKPRDPREQLLFSCLSEKEEITLSSKHKRFANIAASIQAIYEEKLLEIVRDLATKTQTSNLCIAGGGALNCVANSRIKEINAFRNIYIPPDPGDGGTAIGIALYYSAMNSDGIKNKASVAPYLGSNCNESFLFDMLPNIDPNRFSNYLKHGLKKVNHKWTHEVIQDEAALVQHVSKKISNGKIVGWVQGCAEIGPRALGSRSILIYPGDKALAKKLSTTVKGRAGFRPYALSMTPKTAKLILKLDEGDIETYKWMQFAVKVQESFKDQVKAGVHVDNTTRPQICTREQNPIFYSLLEEVGKHTDHEALINTSFNESGYPIIETEIDALAMFARTEMDMLVVNNLVIEKSF